MTLSAQHVGLKVNLKYDLVSDKSSNQKLKLKFEVSNMNHDIPEKYLKLQMEGNTAANILGAAADLAKRLFVDKLVQ